MQDTCLKSMKAALSQRQLPSKCGALCDPMKVLPETVPQGVGERKITVISEALGDFEHDHTEAWRSLLRTGWEEALICRSK